MQAIVMAGGFGTRLRPLTANIPKPMTPLLNKPIIEHILELLKRHKINDLIFILYHQAEVIKDYFKDGKKFGVKIRYVKPDADYGTAGAVHCGYDLVDGRFIIISGDVVTDFDLTHAISFHEKRKSAATLVLTRAKFPLQFGIVLTDKEGKITKFFEKPTWSEVFSDTINTGIYVLEKETLSLVTKARGAKADCDFSKDLFPYLLKHKMPLYGAIESGYWRDVGSLEDYIKTNLEALKGKIDLPLAARLIKNGNVAASSAKISRNSKIINSVIGEKCTIAAGAVIKDSILWSSTDIGEGTRVNHSVLCNNVRIRPNCKINDNIFIGDNVIVGSNVTIKSDVKIWPQKNVDSNSIVNKNLIWEERWKDSLFTDSRITGLSNIEITPDFSARLGMAYGVFAGLGSKILISRDIDNVSLMIKGAITSGLLSSGVIAMDFQTMPIPILRQELGKGSGTGGIFVRKSPFDSSRCDIIFFDSNGRDLSSAKIKSIERLLISNDARPTPFDKIGSITYAERTYESYKERFLANINKEIINKRKIRVAINFSHGITSTILPNIIGEFNIELVTLDSHLDAAKQARSPEEFRTALQQLSYIVTSLKYDAGFLIDAGGEKIYVVDDSGKILSYDRFLSLVVYMYLTLFPKAKKIAVPIQASGEIDIVAKKYFTDIVRVKDSHFAIMNSTADPEVELAGGTKGGVIFPAFSFATDGMFSIMKILELIARSHKRLSDLEKRTPRLHMAKNNVFCTLDQKGKIMRKLVEDSEGKTRQLIDGIKIFFDDYKWVLCIPDSEREIFHVNAEAKTQKAADELVKEYSAKIRKYQESL
ncbi:MAG: NTP transferase domain-containing protein [Ignavibacteria bacterium]|nr:NTP transferase domain-containing protein [Ignavibacteria bacterium]MCC7159242.1 NTP transferase domain-containing protein [Ignavibacteria bacterium]